MTNLSESILILEHFARQVGERTKIMIELESNCVVGNTSVTLLTTFVNANILDVCSYLEEFDEEFGVTSEEEFKERVHMIKQITKPFIKRIRSWNDLDNVRNYLIAHNRREKRKFVDWDEIFAYNIHKSVPEVCLLNACL